MAKVVFTDATPIILATIPLTSVWRTRQNGIRLVKASEVLSGQGHVLRCVSHVHGNVTFPSSAIRSDDKRTGSRGAESLFLAAKRGLL
jgi:hypothetical protein